MSEKNIAEKGKHFLLMTGSTLLMAVGTYFFKFTNNFTFGGITGLAVLVAKTGLMSASDFNLIASMLLLIIGMIILGKKFAAKTAYCSILLSVTLSVLERVCPMNHPPTDQPMLELCFAIALPAMGSAVLFNIGSSSGGTDIIAMILKKYSSFDIGHALLASDVLITAAGFFVFDVKTGLYSLLGLTVRSFMVDSFIESLNLSKYFNVVCDHPDNICDFIVHDLNRSASVCHAKGAYSGQDKYIILTALNRAQAVQLRNFIKKEDPNAFILISNTSEIIGKGFHSI
nr:YitT family protein [uncultured Mediterraneibacter sp.]